MLLTACPESSFNHTFPAALANAVILTKDRVTLLVTVVYFCKIRPATSQIDSNLLSQKGSRKWIDFPGIYINYLLLCATLWASQYRPAGFQNRCHLDREHAGWLQIKQQYINRVSWSCSAAALINSASQLWLITPARWKASDIPRAHGNNKEVKRRFKGLLYNSHVQEDIYILENDN